jgi:hypothetical protein
VPLVVHAHPRAIVEDANLRGHTTGSVPACVLPSARARLRLVGDAPCTSNHQRERRNLGDDPSEIADTVSGTTERRTRLTPEVGLSPRTSYDRSMTDDSTPRQHASADVAPELYEPEDER